MTELNYNEKLKATSVELPALPNDFKKGQLLRHIDGGFYRFDKVVYSSVDQSFKVVYDHVWPFEPSSWERPFEEFKHKFIPVEHDVLQKAQQTDLLTYRLSVKNNRETRRASELDAKVNALKL